MKATIITAVVLVLAVAVALALTGRESHRTVTPAQLLASGGSGTFQLVGFVASPPQYRSGLEFVLTDAPHTARVRVHYSGAAEALETGEKVSVTGRLRDGVFVAQPDTLVAGCATAGSATHC